MNSMPHLQPTSARCHQCNAPLQLMKVPPPPGDLRELTLHYTCTHCSQTYEVQFVSIAIFATSPGGEALAQVRRCERCSQLYLLDRPHVCQGEAPSA